MYFVLHTQYSVVLTAGYRGIQGRGVYTLYFILTAGYRGLQGRGAAAQALPLGQATEGVQDCASADQLGGGIVECEV